MNSVAPMRDAGPVLDAVDRRIVLATQDGLPLVPHPWRAVAERVGVAEQEVIGRVRRLQQAGILRRIAAVPDHYRLGYAANGMSVWDVDDARVVELGERVGALPFVTHCYQRPRHLPDWPYNLFAMLHGRDRDTVTARMAEIEALLGDACRGHDVLFSTRILKKTGLRLKERPCSE